MPNNLQSAIAATPNSGDLSPLAANETFRAAVDAELAIRAAAAAAAEAAAAKVEEVASGVRVFASAMSSIRAVAKRFPECAAYVNEAAKQVQLAMSAAAHNPVTPPKPPAPTPTPTSTIVPPTTR